MAGGSGFYPTVWKPIAGRVPASGAITIELDSPIQHLLLEAVRADGHYLSEKFNFIYSPGVIMDGKLRPTQELSVKSPHVLT